MSIALCTRIILLLAPVTATAFGDCAYQRDIDLRLDASQLAMAEVHSAAGDETILGTNNESSAVINGRVCASSQKLLDAAQLTAVTQGDKLMVRSELPEQHGGWNSYAHIDFTLQLPNHLPLTLDDRSGDVRIKDMHGGLIINDRSGDIKISNTAGRLQLSDNSGDIKIDQHQGDLLIESDRSGDIEIQDVDGVVEIAEDRSGDIRIRTVSRDVIIGRDRSGDIDVSDVDGNFNVTSDGSGDISYRDIGGSVNVPEDD
ncbi:MAG: hypothetical protein Tsb002_22510 [Wenzhouxiangellaceae bacterium]